MNNRRALGGVPELHYVIEEYLRQSTPASNSRRPLSSNSIVRAIKRKDSLARQEGAQRVEWRRRATVNCSQDAIFPVFLRSGLGF
jgi:hypothetical protein